MCDVRVVPSAALMHIHAFRGSPLDLPLVCEEPHTFFFKSGQLATKTCASAVKGLGNGLNKEEFRGESKGRKVIALNVRRQPIYWTNVRVRDALGAYFAEHVQLRQRVTAWRSQLNGLAQLGSAFLTNDGGLSTLTRRQTGVSNTSRSYESLTQVISELHDQAGIESALARRQRGARLPLVCTAKTTTFGTSAKCLVTA